MGVLDIFAKKLAEILAVGTGINGIILTIRGLTNIGLALGVLSVSTSLFSFLIGYRKRHFLERWNTDDF